MGIREEGQAVAMQKCLQLGLRPAVDPMGDDHHTDAPMADEDRAIGDALAYFLGHCWLMPIRCN